MKNEDAGAADPYLWLEQVGAENALDWVRQQNAAAERQLEGAPAFAGLHAGVTAILNDRNRIPAAAMHGAYLYNFWRDAVHVRGIWRRTPLAQFVLPEPAWETVLDLDQLAREESENWVWAGAACLKPAATRCLVSLSRGGGDATVVREFDLEARAFVAGGFVLPEAKSSVSWIDHDTLFVCTDAGPGSMTSSGYPRTVREWRRGTPLAAARLLFEAEADDVGVGAQKDFTPGCECQLIWRIRDFYRSELYWRSGDTLAAVPKPDDATAWTVRDQLLIRLRADWTVAGATWPQGALLAIGLAPFMRGARDFALLFAPTDTVALDGVCATRSALMLKLLDKVSGRIVELRHAGGAWQRREVAVPAFGALELSALDPLASDHYFLTTSNFLTPPTLYLAEAGSDRRQAIKAMPALFDAAPYQVMQYESTSSDGARIPYFVVMANNATLDGSNPTLLYGYGGFEVSLKPSYSGVTGQAWLANGGIYVLANIRGGGEFGPRWHQAARGPQRQRAFDDFISVAEDLIARRLTSPRHLGIMGGSNGGLLAGVAMTQRPDLFNAVVCQVPLLDMRRYHRLLAGASWIGEYGDPDDPAQWETIARYSPYHNVSAGRRYPRALLTSSTRDDRVHPGHARKMAALMQAQGHDVLYWENLEGGHAGAANSDQQARMWALTFAFLLTQLN